MLQLKTIDKTTFDLLKELSNTENVVEFALA